MLSRFKQERKKEFPTKTIETECCEITNGPNERSVEKKKQNKTLSHHSICYFVVLLLFFGYPSIHSVGFCLVGVCVCGRKCDKIFRKQCDWQSLLWLFESFCIELHASMADGGWLWWEWATVDVLCWCKFRMETNLITLWLLLSSNHVTQFSRKRKSIG